MQCRVQAPPRRDGSKVSFDKPLGIGPIRGGNRLSLYVVVLQVIKRLVTKDGLLIHHGQFDDDTPDEDKLIGVHPNYSAV